MKKICDEVTVVAEALGAVTNSNSKLDIERSLMEHTSLNIYD